MNNRHIVCIADAFYSNVEPELVSIAVSCPELRQFSFAVTDFENSLGEHGCQDPYWQPCLRYFRRFRFDASAAPLMFSDHTIHKNGVMSELRQSTKHCHLMYPQCVDKLNTLFENIDQLVKLSKNPLIDAIVGLHEPRTWPVTAILLAEPRLIPATTRQLGRLGISKRVKVLAPATLRKPEVFAEMVIVGPPRWFPRYVFDSPRSGRLTVVSFSWQREHWVASKAFLSPGTPASSLQFYTGARDYSDDESVLDNPDIRPSFHDMDCVEKLVSEDLRNAANDRDHDALEMELFLLAGDRAVFLDTTESIRFMVIDLEEENHLHRVKRVSLAEIEPGMFLLLRRDGGGDYILPIANSILGIQSSVLRDGQEAWKGRLRTHVATIGLVPICAELRQNGAQRANENNVRNWMWHRNIRPQDDVDFRSVLRLVGLEDQWNDYRIGASRILRAHMQAGARVRRQLLQLVHDADLDLLESLGYMDFTVADPTNVTLSAVRVVNRPSIYKELPARRSGHLIEMEDARWRE